MEALTYFADIYQHKATSIIQEQRPNTDKHYPFGVVAVNLTLMLADVIELRERKFSTSERPYWEIFRRRAAAEPDEVGSVPAVGRDAGGGERGGGVDAFLELFSLAFRILDHEWHTRRANRKGFSQVHSIQMDREWER